MYPKTSPQHWMPCSLLPVRWFNKLLAWQDEGSDLKRIPATPCPCNSAKKKKVWGSAYNHNRQKWISILLSTPCGQQSIKISSSETTKHGGRCYKCLGAWVTVWHRWRHTITLASRWLAFCFILLGVSCKLPESVPPDISWANSEL